MNLLALTRDPARRIVRLPLAQNVQAEVERVFKAQEEDFRGTIEQEHEFDGKYKPDEGECLFIKDYDDIDNIHEAIADPLIVPTIRPELDEFAGVKALFVGYKAPTGERVALIQSFDRRKIISPAGMSIFHSADVYKKVDGVGLTLDSKLATILTEDVLKFFSFHVVRQIFDLSQYFVEATNTDLEEFAKCESIHIGDQVAFISVADSWIRRKVTLVTQGQILEKIDVATIKKAALVFNIDLQTTNVNGKECIVLPANKAELKKILRFLDEDYYQSSLLSINYLTNSKRPA
jgi:hypothetical protein